MYFLIKLWLNGFLLTLTIMCIEREFVLEVDRKSSKCSLRVSTASIAICCLFYWPLILFLLFLRYSFGQKK